MHIADCKAMLAFSHSETRQWLV